MLSTNQNTPLAYQPSSPWHSAGLAWVEGMLTTNNSPCATRRQHPFTRVDALSPLDRPMQTPRLPLRAWMTLRRLRNSSVVSAYSANKYYKRWRSRLPLVSQKPNFTADPATRCPNDRGQSRLPPVLWPSLCTAGSDRLRQLCLPHILKPPGRFTSTVCPPCLWGCACHSVDHFRTTVLVDIVTSRTPRHPRYLRYLYAKAGHDQCFCGASYSSLF